MQTAIRLVTSCVLAGFVLAFPPQRVRAADDAGKAARYELSDALRKRCLQVIRQGLHSNEFWPSMHAAEALTVAGHGEEARKVLEPKLQTERDDQKRCGLARELTRAGDRSKVVLLLDILAKKDPHGHVHAAESLYKIGEVGDGRLLRKALAQDKDPSLQVMAAAALARCGSPAALAVLRQQATNDKPEINSIAAWVLGRLGDKSDIPQLHINVVRTKDAPSRAFSEHALAALGDPKGLRALTRNLADKDPALRVEAANSAGDARISSVADQLVKLLDDATLDVRIRAAQALLTLSQPTPPSRDEEIRRDVYRATEKNPRYSEGSIIELHDGSLLYATTEFEGTTSDFAKARIIAKASRDGGRTWGPVRVLQENVGKMNVIGVTLRRLAQPGRADTPIGMFYCVTDSNSDLRVYLRVSHDEGRTFGQPILVTTSPGYHVMNNDRVTTLSSGRILCPDAWTSDQEKENHYVSFCYLSDDGGKTWRQGKGRVDQPKRGAMEPELIELKDGRVLMIVRNQLGHIAASYSTDGGDTWSAPAAWNVKSPESPATLRRIPATGDLLLIWNNSYTPGADHGGKRTPLTAAVSSDEGRTWKQVRNLEDNPEEGYAYTSITFVGGRVLLSYYVDGGKPRRISSRFRSLPVEWFYEKTGKQNEAIGWKPRPVRQGDGKGGWVARPAEYRFLHKSGGKYVLPFGVVQMGNGEIALIASWHDGKTDKAQISERPVIAFSKDRGDTWTEFTVIPDAAGRPMMLSYLGKGNLMFQTDLINPVRQYFSNDYGRTWPERLVLQAAANGGTHTDGASQAGYFGVEGNALIDRDAQGVATRIAEIGWNYDKGSKWPNAPANGIVRWSSDGGRTWTNETIPKVWKFQVEYQGKTYTRGVSEGSLIRAANGWLVAALRTDIPPRYLDVPHDDSLEGTGISISKDDSATWSPIKMLYDAGRHHAHLLRLPNGDLVMTHHVRVDVRDGRLASYRRGCEAVVSHDHGLTWDLGRKYILDDYEFYDGVKWYNGECGHLSSALLDDGSILTCYGKYLTKGVSLIRWRPHAD